MNYQSKVIKLSRDRGDLKNILLFSLGMGISSLGTIIYTFATGLYILKISGSGLSFAINLTISMLPVIILMPLGGALADRWNKKLIVVATDFLNGFLFLGVFFLTKDTSPTLFLLYTTTLLASGLTTVFAVTLEASKPLLVREEKLMSINSIDQIVGSSVSILGPLLGGLVFSLLDIRMFFLINGFSFIFSALIETLMDFNYNKAEINKESGNNHIFKDIQEGLNYLRGKQKIITIIKLCIFLNFFFCFSVTVPLPYLINEKLGLEPKAYGIIQGGFAVGMIIGALFIKKLSSIYSREKFFFTIGSVIALCILTFSIPTSSILHMGQRGLISFYTCLTLILGALIASFDLPLFYILQREVREEFRGRVMGLTMSFVKTVTPLAFILSGVFLEKVSLHTLSFTGGLLLLSFIIYTWILQDK